MNEWLKANGLIIGCLVVLVIILIFLAWPKELPPTPINTVNEQMKKDLAKAENDIKAKDVAIKDLKNKLTVSEGRAAAWRKKYEDLQRDKDDVLPPKTDKELRDRFIALGFPPAPVGICGTGFVCFPTGFGQ